MGKEEKYTPFTVLENSIADKIIQDLSLSHLGFYYILRSYSDGNYKPVFPSYEILQKRTNKGKKQIKRIETDLSKFGFIKIDKKYKKVNVYTFINPFLMDKDTNMDKNGNIPKNVLIEKPIIPKMSTILTNMDKNVHLKGTKMGNLNPDLVNAGELNGERNQIYLNHIYNKEPDLDSFSSNTNLKKEDKNVENVNDIIKSMGLLAADVNPTELNKKTPKPVEKKENILSDDKIKQEWLTKKAYRYYDQYVKKVPNINELNTLYSKENVFTVLYYLDFEKRVMFCDNFDPKIFKNTLNKILREFDTHAEFQNWYQNQLLNHKKEIEKQRAVDEESRKDADRWQKEEEFDKWRKTLTNEKFEEYQKMGIAGRVALMEYYFRMKMAGGEI